MTPLEKALDLAAKGYHVFPVRVAVAEDGSNTKAYPTKWVHGGPGQAATTDPEIVRHWFAVEFTDCIVGIATGPSGIVVADLDTKHNQDGPAEWAKLTGPYPLPAAVGTSSTGGKHLPYRADPTRPIKTSAGEVAPGVDTRATGGMVIAWGDWWPRREMLPAAPEVLHERVPLAPSATPPAAGGGADDPFAAPARAFTREDARRFCADALAALDGAAPNTVNHRLNTAAKVLYHFVPEIMSRAAADARLSAGVAQACAANGTRQDPAHDRSTLASAWGASRRDWIAVLDEPPDPPAAPADGETAGAGPDAELAFEVARQRRQRDARALLDAEEAARLADGGAVAAMVEQLLTSAALGDIPDLESLISGWLFKDSMARLVGKSGTYKSFVALDMACHVAAGKPWFGHESAAGAVVYVVAEGARGVRRRVRAWEAKHLLPLGDKLLILPRPVQMVGPEWLAFVGACRAVGAAMVVLDTQARVTVGVEENSAREMGQVVAMGERLRIDTGACILLVHHTGHAGEHGRGSTSVYGALQTELSLERVADQRVSLKATKQKDHDELGPVNLKLEPCCESLVLANLDGTDDVSAPAIEESMRTLTMANGTHAERVAIVLHGVWRGGHGATRAELLAAVREEYSKAGLPEIGKSAFHRAMTSIQANGWTREGRTAARMIVSAAGCLHLGVDYEGSFDLDDES